MKVLSKILQDVELYLSLPVILFLATNTGKVKFEASNSSSCPFSDGISRMRGRFTRRGKRCGPILSSESYFNLQISTK
jgi:hypothetical protein